MRLFVGTVPTNNLLFVGTGIVSYERRPYPNGIFRDQIWTNSGLTHGYAQAGMGKHVTKLTNINSFQINNISFKFH